MRFEINMDCTPEEARQFFGLPDILPMQQELMEMVSRRLSENIQTMEPEALMKTWVPALFQGWSDVQSTFWKQMTQTGVKMGPTGPMGFSMGMTEPKKEPPSKPSATKSRKK